MPLAASDTTLPILLAVIALVGPVVVAAATLLGIWITTRNDRQRERERRDWERERWRTDLRVSAYSDLIRAADDYRKACTDLHGAEPTGPRVVALAQALEDQSHLLDRAGSRVNLVGAKEVQAALNTLAAFALKDMSDAAQAQPEVPDAVWNPIVNRFFDLYDAFLNVARQDIGFDRLPSATPVERQ